MAGRSASAIRSSLASARMSSEEWEERRLHAFTLIFAVWQGLKEALFPLLAFVFTGGSRRSELVRALFVLLAVLVPVGFAIARYLAFRYQFRARELVIRTGIFFRKERHIPYDRIQNIDATQNVLHRMLDVAIVQVQTASGGTDPEASLSVLSLPALEEMRARVMTGKSRPASGTIAPPGEEAAGRVEVEGDVVAVPPPAVAPARTLLQLPLRELAIAGFIENRGLVLILATFAFVMQVDPLEELLVDRLTNGVMVDVDWQAVFTRSSDHAGTYALYALAVLVVALAFVRALSTVWGMIRLFGYRLTLDGETLRFEYGLLTRVVGSVPLARVQTITVHRKWLHRLVGRAEVRIATAGAPGEAGPALRLRQPIAPIIRDRDIAGLLEELHPGSALDAATWNRGHPRAWRRVAIRPTLFALAGSFAAVYLAGAWGWLAAALLAARAAILTRLYVVHHGWALIPGGVAFRSGGLHRTVTLSRFTRVQSVALAETPFDRRAGMQRIVVDTAGATMGLAYLPAPEAQMLHGHVARNAEQVGFTW